MVRSTKAPTVHVASSPDIDRQDNSRSVPDQLYGVGCFPHLSDLEFAVIDLRSIGFPLNQISLVAHQFQRTDQLTGVALHDRLEATPLGISSEQARFYHDPLDQGEHVIIVQGTNEELNHVASMLSRRGVQEWSVSLIP